MGKPENPYIVEVSPEDGTYSAITLRDLFAGLAMAGYLADGCVSRASIKEFTESSYQVADALLQAREADNA